MQAAARGRGEQRSPPAGRGPGRAGSTHPSDQVRRWVPSAGTHHLRAVAARDAQPCRHPRQTLAGLGPASLQRERVLGMRA